MNNASDKQGRRLVFLNRLYELTQGSIQHVPMVNDVAQELGWPIADAYDAIDYLQGERLVETSAMESRVSLTHAGVREVEAALNTPEKPTPHFPPAQNVLVVHGGVHGSPIQQGSHSSTQTISYAQTNTDDLRQFITLVKNELPNLRMADDDRSQAEAEVSTIQAQLAAPRPNVGVIKASGEALHGILLGVAGNLATNLLVHLMGFAS